MCGVSSDINPLPSRKEEKSHGKRLPSHPHISDFQASRHQLADHQDQDSPDWFRYPVGVPLWDCPSVHHLSCHSTELQGPRGFHAAGARNEVILARDWLQEAASPQTRTARQTVSFPSLRTVWWVCSEPEQTSTPERPTQGLKPQFLFQGLGGLTLPSPWQALASPRWVLSYTQTQRCEKKVPMAVIKQKKMRSM